MRLVSRRCGFRTLVVQHLVRRLVAGLGDPSIPCVVLAGNTSLAGAATGARVKRILKKVLHKTASIAFLFEPNDLAVSVNSVGSVGSTWGAPPETRPMACEKYFAAATTGS